MVARRMKTVKRPGGKKISVRKSRRSEALTRNEVNGRTERSRTFPKTLPGEEIVRKDAGGSRVRYFHRKTP